MQGALEFPAGAVWQIGSFDEELLDMIEASAARRPRLFAGMEVLSTQRIAPPEFSSKEQFDALSPVLVRDHDSELHLTYEDRVAAAEIMTGTLRHRLDRAGLGDVHLEYVEFSHYRRARTKIVTIGPAKFRANVCPVIITGDPVAVQYAWTCGIGHGTGLGFGWLEKQKTRRNHEQRT